VRIGDQVVICKLDSAMQPTKVTKLYSFDGLKRVDIQEAAAGGLALINSIGALGGFAGPYLVGYLKDSYGTFTAGMLGLAVVLGVTTLLTLSLFAFDKRK